jgi:hypothetical protein
LCILQVSHVTIQDDFEAGHVQLSVSANASSQSPNEQLLQETATARVNLTQLPDMSVGIALANSQSDTFTQTGRCAGMQMLQWLALLQLLQQMVPEHP